MYVYLYDLKGTPGNNQRKKPIPSYVGPCHAKNVSSGKCGQQRPRSDCASAQSDLGLRCPLTEPLDTTECMNGEKRPGWYFAHAQYELNLRILRMFENTFSLDATKFIAYVSRLKIKKTCCPDRWRRQNARSGGQNPAKGKWTQFQVRTLRENSFAFLLESGVL